MPRNTTTVKLPRRKTFTISDCIALNANLNDQTVRTFVRTQIAEGRVTVIGRTTSSGRGRPAFILALVP